MKASYRKVIFLMIFFSISTVIILGGIARAETADDLLSQGIWAYENGEYQLSIERLSRAIPLLRGDRERIEAFKTMAFAYMAFPKKEKARQQFCNILELNPNFDLDPIMTSPKILAVFKEAKQTCSPLGGIRVRATSGDQKPIPGAKVYLNEELIGETPLQRKDILPGEYEVEVNKEGFRSFKARVSIEGGGVREVESNLIKAKMPTITSVDHDVVEPLVAGDRIEVTLKGDPDMKAAFDIGDVKKNLSMKEVSPGRYVGVYRVGEEDQFSNLIIVGYLEESYGFQASKKADRPVSTSVFSRAQLHFRRGKACMERGEYDLAIDSLAKALYEDPNFVKAHILLAKAYTKKKGAYLESIKYLKNALELDPDNLEACTLLARIYIENGKYEDALPVVKGILEIAPNSGFAYGYMGEILHYKGKDQEAIEALRRSLQLDQGNPRVYFLLGKVFERLGRLTDAVLEYETAVDLSPTTYKYRDALATCYRALDQEMSAFRHWERCLDLDDLTELDRREVKRRLSELRR